MNIGDVGPNGFVITAVVPFPHKGDSHLYTVMGQRMLEGFAEYAVWDYNSQTNGYANGHYPQYDRQRAFIVFAKRIDNRTCSAFGLDTFI